MNLHCGSCKKPVDDSGVYSVDGYYHESCLAKSRARLANAEEEAARVLLIHYRILISPLKEKYSDLLIHS